MKNFMPQSRSGKWAVGLGIALVVLMALSLVFAFAIKGDAAVVEENLFLPILALTLNLTLNFAGLLSFIVGIYTIIKHKEWSLWKPLATLYSLALLLFVLGEFLFPH